MDLELVEKIIELAHAMRCEPEDSLVNAMAQWDELLAHHAGVNLLALWGRDDEFLKTLYASNGVSMDVTLAPSQSMVAHVFSSQTTGFIDYSEVGGSSLDSHPEIIAGFNIGTAVFFPVRVRGEVVGVLATFLSAEVGTSKLSESLMLPIVDHVADLMSLSDRETAIQFEDELLFASAAALDALVSAMSHYHELSHSNVAALNVCGKIYQVAKQARRKDLMLPLTDLDGYLRNSRGALDHVKESYLSVTEPQVSFEQINLKEFGEQIKGEYGPRAEQGGVEFEVELGDGILLSNRRKIEAIFSNLIRNSFDFVRPITQAKHIRLTSRAEGEVATFVLEDNGIGMSEETLSLATGPFYSTRKSDGVGLFVVNGFTKQLEGDFIIESELGFGTKATVRLPGLETHNG